MECEYYAIIGRVAVILAIIGTIVGIGAALTWLLHRWDEFRTFQWKLDNLCNQVTTIETFQTNVMHRVWAEQVLREQGLSKKEKK